MERVFIAGGAGFIGSHFSERLLKDSAIKQLTCYDNLSSGKLEFLAEGASDPRFKFVNGYVSNFPSLMAAMREHDTVIHLASNPDIARAAREPTIDFFQGTSLTNSVAEAARLSGVRTIIYASGSGVYGELGEKNLSENHGPLLPISTYGASKLAGEAILSAYHHMFGMRCLVFRFANVVGAHQTHGVVYDFLSKLKADPRSLHILGDGNQSKSYIHIDDVLNAVLLAESKVGEQFEVFNVATDDCITVKEIADIVTKTVVANPESVRISYSGGDRGWQGDIPIVRLNTEKIRALGWHCRLNACQAISSSAIAMATRLQMLTDQLPQGARESAG